MAAIEEEDNKFESWEEDNDDDEDQTVKSLFCDLVFPSVSDLIASDKESFGFDLREAAGSVQYDDIALIMLVNFIRRRVHGLSSPAVVNSSFIDGLKTDLASKSFLQDDTNMRPVLNDDPLLFLLRDALIASGTIVDDDDEEIEAKETQAAIASAQQQLQLAGGSSSSSTGGEELLKKYQLIVASLTAEPDATTKDTADDSYYFSSYSHISIHETMLRDHPRTSTYADALVANSSYLKGKVVLDVGCGTGILCMLAVRAGAKKVIGVDMSSIISRTQKVIEKNGMSDVISLVRGRLEDVKLPLNEDEEVDIIVSEWMGYGLYFENMLTSVLYARDEYLSKDGILMPSDAMIYIETMTATGADDRIAWWSNVYDFDMSDMSDLLSDEAQVQLVDAEAITSNRCLAHSLSIKTANASLDLDFETSFVMVIQRDQSDLRAFVLSFDVLFAAKGFEKEVVLSTGTSAAPTHWKQTVFWLDPENISVVQKDDKIVGILKYKRSTSNARDYDITISWRIEKTLDSKGSNEVKSQTFILGS